MSAPALPRCTVLVVNYNGGKFLGECLHSLQNQIVSGLTVDVVVVDNASTDGSAELLDSQFPQMRVIRSPTNVGFAGAVNLGMARTEGELVVLLNPDATADRYFLRHITAPLLGGGTGGGPDRDAPGVAAVTGRIVLTGRFVPAAGPGPAYVAADGRRWVRLPAGTPADAGVELLNSTGSQLSRSGNGRDRSWLAPVDSTAPPDVFGFCGGACALLRSAVDAVGGFDERLFLYYEDTDLSWRLRRSGWSIRYAAEAVVHHQHSASSGIHSRVFLRHNLRNRVLVTARSGPLPMIGSAVVHTVGHLLLTLTRCLGRRTGQQARTEAAAALWALARLVPMFPTYLVQGRRLDRTARLPRRFVEQWIREDGVD